MIRPVIAEELIFKFTRGGMVGWDIAWSGVIVKVNGNSVTPTFARRRGVITYKNHHNKTVAIKACKKTEDGFAGFSGESNCITTKNPTIEIPAGDSPYDYSYRFLHTVENKSWESPVTEEDGFTLDRESAAATAQENQRKEEVKKQRRESQSRDF